MWFSTYLTFNTLTFPSVLSCAEQMGSWRHLFVQRNMCANCRDSLPPPPALKESPSPQMLLWGECGRLKWDGGRCGRSVLVYRSTEIPHNVCSVKPFFSEFTNMNKWIWSHEFLNAFQGKMIGSQQYTLDSPKQIHSFLLFCGIYSMHQRREHTLPTFFFLTSSVIPHKKIRGLKTFQCHL